MTTSTSNNFYCSQKFTWLSVDLAKLETLSCCAATPAKIDIDGLKLNPGKIFNSVALINERQFMLDNRPVASCSISCWQPESNSLTSRRLQMQSTRRTHTNVVAVPETLNIMVGKDCNMSCVYCCKAYSSSWANDIATHGPYTVKTADDRFDLSVKDRLIMKLSQKEIGNSESNKVLLDEITIMCNESKLKEVMITGGEPFLYVGLEQLISKLSKIGISTKIWSGLGVNTVRFKKEIEKISKFSNIEVVISAEATGPLYEVLRYGNSWQRFEENLSILEECNINHSFYGTVTNLTLLGIEDFISWAKIKNKKVTYHVCTDPAFLATNMLDPVSKTTIINNLNCYQNDLQQIVMDNLSLDVSVEEHDKLKIYLSEFARRRNLSLDFLPQHFRNWIL